MKTKSFAALAALATLALAVPAPAQTVAAPRVTEHRSITIAEAFPELGAGQGFVLHARKIELSPGARTELVDHASRPSITYVTRGEVMEHREGAAPLRHGLHAATMDRGGIRHYWENASAVPAELLVVDLVPADPR